MKKFYHYLSKAEIIISASCFSISCIVIFVAALARSFNQPINWSQDLSLFLFSWSVFLSADVSMRADKLVSVDILTNRFSKPLQRKIAILNYCIILIFLAALVIYGIKLSIFSWRRVFQGIPGFSYGWVALSLPIGSVLLGATAIQKIKALLTNGTTKHAGSED